MKLSGTMVGVSAEYLNNGGVGRIKGSIPVQLRARLNYMQGKLDYKGGIVNFGTGEVTPYKYSGSKTDNKNYFFDTALLGGLEFKMGGNFYASPYIGFGYRYLEDKKSKDPFDYKREQAYYYLPVGADWKNPLASGWGLAFNTEVDILLSGRNTTHDVSDSGKLKFRQKSGYGWRLGAKVEKNLHSVDVFAEPFFRYWNISRSDIVHGFVEPKNRTEEYGLRIGVSF